MGPPELPCPFDGPVLLEFAFWAGFEFAFFAAAGVDFFVVELPSPGRAMGPFPPRVRSRFLDFWHFGLIGSIQLEWGR